MMQHMGSIELGPREHYDKQITTGRNNEQLLEEFISHVPKGLSYVEDAIENYNLNRFMLSSYKNNRYYCLVFCGIPDFYQLMANSFFYQFRMVSQRDIGSINIARDTMSCILKNAAELAESLNLAQTSNPQDISDSIKTVPQLKIFLNEWPEIVYLLSYMNRIYPQIASIHVACDNLLSTVYSADDHSQNDVNELNAEFYFVEILSFVEKILSMKSQFDDYKLGFVSAVGVFPILLEILDALKVVLENGGNGFLNYCPFVTYKTALLVLHFIVTVLTRADAEFYEMLIGQLYRWPSIIELLLFFVSRWTIHKLCVDCDEPLPNPHHKKNVSDENHVLFFTAILLRQLLSRNNVIIIENCFDIISVLSSSLCKLQVGKFQPATIATSITLGVIVDTLKIVYSQSQHTYYKDVLQYLNKTLTTDFVEVLSRCTLWPSQNKECLFLEDFCIVYRVKIVENAITLLNLLSFIILHSRDHLNCLHTSNILSRMYLIHKNTVVPSILRQIELASSWLVKLNIDCYSKSDRKKFRKIKSYFTKIYKKQKNMDSKNNAGVSKESNSSPASKKNN